MFHKRVAFIFTRSADHRNFSVRVTVFFFIVFPKATITNSVCSAQNDSSTEKSAQL
jgi:hypothetical protein